VSSNPHELRSVFLSRNNYLGGKYFAEIVKETFDSWHDPTLLVEFSIALHGTSQREWHSMAHWILSNNLHHSNNRWVVQINRSYQYLAKHSPSDRPIHNFQDVLDNIFKPLFAVCINGLLRFGVVAHYFMSCVCGCVDVGL
jgi:AMP deaminase